VKIIKNKNKKTIAEIHFLTDRKKIKNRAVINIIKKSLLRCYYEIPILNKKVAIYFTRDLFIKNRMDGVGADVQQENVIALYINPTKGWKKALENSIAHEYSHLAVLDTRKWKTILDSLVIEGIAENFREEVIGGKQAPWTKALTKNQSKKLLKNLKNKLGVKAEKLHQALFFGSGKYKMWAGYTVGYLIVKEFRKRHPNMKWKSIITLKSSVVLKKSKFLSKS
jgi:uncharacterized protein YjaZ